MLLRSEINGNQRVIRVKICNTIVLYIPAIILGVQRFSSSHRRCILCNEKTNLRNVPPRKRFLAMIDARIYIPKSAKLCALHYNNNSWNGLSEEYFQFTFNASQIEDMVDLMRVPINHQQSEYQENFRSDYGLDIHQFDELFSRVPSILRAFNNNEMKAKNALRMYMMRLRKGTAYHIIGERFRVSENTVTTYIRKVRTVLQREYVPQFLGFKNLSRDFLKYHSTKSARIALCNSYPHNEPVITIWDGTYIYCHKSGNYRFQKNTYTDQKKRNYVKPMVCVTPDGYIVDVFGPFKAIENDAKIMQIIFDKKEEVKNVLMPSDVIVVDRGFRDCIVDLKKLNYEVKIPEFIVKSDKTGQLTTEKANKSRLVTKVRFVVEVRNAHLKRIWQCFGQTWACRSILHLRADLRIGAALINHFFSNIVADKDNDWIATSMIDHLNEPNMLTSIVNRYDFQRQLKNFLPIDLNSTEFPMLSEDDLKRISLGTYQLNAAKSYAKLHIESNDNKFLCFLSPLSILNIYFQTIIDAKNIIQPALVLTQMESRFKNRKTYNVFVLVDMAKRGANIIVTYHCECRHGLRTIGCCSHIMSTIYYLCHARRLGGVRPVAGYLNELFDYDSESDDDEN